MTNQPAPFTVLVVDDEPAACENLALLLAPISALKMVGVCHHGFAALEFIRTHQPDLVFLDIQMPEMTGFEMLNQLDPAHRPLVVFVTAYDRYLLQAFEVHAIDYLLKPVDDIRFQTTIERAITLLQQQQIHAYSTRLIQLLEQRGIAQTPNSAVPETPYAKRFVIKSVGRIYFVEVDDIDWVEAAGSYVQFHTGGKKHLLRASMNHIEAQLEDSRFLRIHRSYIVNMAFVRELRPHLRGEYIVTLKDGTELKLSRRNRPKLERYLAEKATS